MTYRDLLKMLETFDESKLNQNVTIFDDNVDEFYLVQADAFTTEEEDVLDPSHYILIINS